MTCHLISNLIFVLSSGHAYAVGRQDIVKQCVDFVLVLVLSVRKKATFNQSDSTEIRKREKHFEKDKAECSEDDIALWIVTGEHKKSYHVYLCLNNKLVHA